MPYSSGPGGYTPTLPEVTFLMVEIHTLKPYIYSLVSYLFIKEDQMIMTCNSAVASLMLSRFLIVKECKCEN
jgi:hypothetical protein